MNKEEKQLLGSGIEVLKALRQRIRETTETSARIAPVTFFAECENCKKLTMHVSHIVGTKFPAWGRPVSTTAMLEPLKTCLACGLTTYRE